MNLICQAAQERLLDGANDAPLSEHVRTCEACRSFAFALEAVDADLAALPLIDAPEPLVEHTLLRIASDAGLHLVHAEPASTTELSEALPSTEATPASQVADAAPLDTSPLGLGSLLLAALSMLIAAVGALLFLPLTLLTWLREFARWTVSSGPAWLRSVEKTAVSERPGDGPVASDVSDLASSPSDVAWDEALATRGRRVRWAIAIAAMSCVCAGVLVFGTLGSVRNARMSSADGVLLSAPRSEAEPSPAAPAVEEAQAFARLAGDEPTSGRSPFGYGRVTGPDPLADLSALARGEDPAAPNFGGGGFGGLSLRGTGRGGGGTGEGTIGLGNIGTIGHGAGGGASSHAFDDTAGADQSVRRSPRRRSLATGSSTTASTPAAPTRIRGSFEVADDTLDNSAELDRGRFQGGRDAQDRAQQMAQRNGVLALQAGQNADQADLDALFQAANRQRTPIQDLESEDTENVARERERDGVVDASPWLEAQRTTGLTFAPHDGWWENTYVPGDSAIRMLQARVASLGGPYLSIAERATPTVPTVAAPTERAIAVGVHADRASIEGPTRVRVEVGLRGIAQAAGRRGALRVALVIDAEDALDASAQARIRSLVTSLARSAGSRDRVMLVAASSHGGTIVPLGAMRAGAVEVALRRLFGAGDRNASPTSLTEAVSQAVAGVTSDDGAGLVLLATPDGVHDAALEDVIRQGALTGVVTSAVGLSPSASTNLDAIALAGQGRRGLVLDEDDAERIVRSEFTATARLIARALRLRVRLAPGVELIEVLGSHPLNQEESRRTRATETAIDQQLSRRLGIAADRDDDQDGIRILLPSFYASDSHTVVLDLLVTRPGPVVDVDVQFKDLVRLGNGNVSAALSLPSGTTSRGVREQRVLASYLAQRVSIALAAAGDLASSGNWSSASMRIEETRSLIDAARREVPSLAQSPSIQADEALLTQYLSTLRGDLVPNQVADSLRYASHRRLLLPQRATIE